LKKLFFLNILFLCSTLLSQEINFYGEAKPGGIVIGVGKNIVSAFLNETTLRVDKSGAFVFGFDRDANGKAKLEVHFENKKVETYEYVVETRDYEEQRLTLARKYITPPKRESKRIKYEAQLMKSARAKIGKMNDALYTSGFTYPVDSVDIRSTFGVQRILNGKPSNVHNGLDFGAEEGDSIYAISDGIVRIAGEDFFYNGNFVLLDHGQGLSSIYLHLSKIITKNGQMVKKGELIGLAGSTGRATGPHLHLGVQWYKKRIDPMSLFSINLPSKEGS
jgi:murein DD-endopeptidase MepM/ murein hydrolase activator NlpD